MPQLEICKVCGIAGYWNFNEVKPPSLCQSMRHRGPEGFGTWQAKSIILHHSRLAIIDLSTFASQPMSVGNDVAISFNGEIYNYKRLRVSLERKGHKFESESDTEVILKLYLEYGIDFIEKLRGMFAIALYDGRNKDEGPSLFLIRDHFGIKPLLYSKQGEGLVFGSEIKIILDSGMVSKEIDSFAVRELLAVGSIYQPRTILKEIKSVDSGCYLQINELGVSEKRWWNPSQPLFDFSSALDSELISLGEQVLNESIQAHLVADVPVSILLSGGLDSSLLTAMTSNQLERPLDTFTVGFASDLEIDERLNARQVSNLFSTNHEEISLNSDKIEETLMEFVQAIDQPSMDGFNSFLVTGAVSKHSKVTLSGTGGDELFAGYPWFGMAKQHSTKFEAGLLSVFSRKNTSLIKYFPSLFHKYAFKGNIGFFHQQNQAFGYERAQKLLNSPTYLAHDYMDSFLDFESRDLLKDKPELSRLGYLCLTGYAKNQLLRDIDSTSMSHSLEVRLPLLDIEVFNFSSSLPDQLKLRMNPIFGDGTSYRNSGSKYILGKISEKYLPPDFLDRKKQGFSLPIDDWLRGPLSSLVKSKFVNNSAVSNLGLSSKEVATALEDFNNRDLPAIKIWVLLILILWYENLVSEVI